MDPDPHCQNLNSGKFLDVRMETVYRRSFEVHKTKNLDFLKKRNKSFSNSIIYIYNSYESTIVIDFFWDRIRSLNTTF